MSRYQQQQVRYLSLQLAHCSCEIEHQFGDVLQLALQDLDGISLLLVLKKKKKHATTAVQLSVSPVNAAGICL